MNWDDLYVFCHVVEDGGFSAAGRHMQRPTSSVSASVARLEERLGNRLLERTTRRLRLTEAGELLYNDVATPVAQLRDRTAEALARGNRVSGLLRIAAPYEFGAHHLARPACHVMTEHPELQVEIEVEHETVDLFERHYDLVFATTDTGVPPSSVVARRIFSLPRALFAAPELVHARGGLPRHPSELAQWPLLAGREDREWRFQQNSESAQISTAQPRMRTGNAGIRLQAALAGLGIMRVTATYGEPAVRDGHLLRLLPQWQCEPLRMYALYPQRRLLPAKVRLFLDRLQSMAADASAAER